MTVIYKEVPWDVIPVKLIKSEIELIWAKDACDQASAEDLIFRNSLQQVLNWYDSQRYKDTERWFTK